jgi:hypothetical protein
MKEISDLDRDFSKYEEEVFSCIYANKRVADLLNNISN